MAYGKRRMPPSLTSDELRQIQNRERESPSEDVRRLLWEVFRLRIVARSAYRLTQGMKPLAAAHPSTSDIVLMGLMEEFKGLPFLLELQEQTDRLFAGGKTIGEKAEETREEERKERERR